MTSVEAQERDHLDVPTRPQRFKQRIPTPPLSTGWRWGFPILLVAAITWSTLLVVEGFNQVLESEEGATLDVITDVTAPGFEAFVEQTWSLLLVSQDDEGQLTGVTVLAVADRLNGGGTVLVLPPEAASGTRTLAGAHEATGVDGLRDAVVDILDVEVTNTALLTPPRLRSLAEPAGMVRVPIDDASVAGADAPDYLGLSFDDPLQRVARQEAWWRAWFATVGAASDPADRLPAIVIELVDVVRAVAAGDVRVVAWPSLDPGAEWVDRMVVETFPFPIPAVQGSRTTVRLLNGNGDFSIDDVARELLVAAGAEVSVVGNHEDFDLIGTRVLYRDPISEAEAARLAVVVGGGTLHDPLLSPAADLTVILGADFAAEHGSTPAGDSAVDVSTGGGA
ncbi:MAG: LytR C-terminal domain-containing protein [Actinomycetota bacterium]|nr:LytR C-terminal domain-containing protein [Actinomycetota bacterium]